MTAGFVALQMLVMGTTSEVGWLQAALRGVGHVPSWAMVATGITLGAAASWLGWRAGGSGQLRAAGGPAAAAA